jgi:PTH1 family peptidyl-tRNA hydrolase
MLVVHDSLEHRPQTVAYKRGGSANGHNGVKSVISAISSADFHRLRIGIGRDSALDPAEYVLREFPSQERLFWTEGRGLDLVFEELEKVVASL